MLTYSMFSETGGRSENEDCVGAYQKKKRSVFLLADGLGGHGLGQQASACAVHMGDVLLQESEDQPVGQYLAGVFEQAHQNLKEMQERSGQLLSMRTTLAAVVIEGEEGWIAHIGDSRVYVFENGKLVNRTLDHSVPQMLVLSGEIKEGDIRHHPDRNRLLRCLGDTVEIPKYEIQKPIKIQKGMSVLLCSDGFWEQVTEKQMARDLRWSKDVDSWLARMKRRVSRAEKKESNQDNYSAIGIWFR